MKTYSEADYPVGEHLADQLLLPLLFLMAEPSVRGHYRFITTNIDTIHQFLVMM